MMNLERILQRLDLLESQQSIRTLATAYAIAYDERDLPRLADLFTTDADFCSADGVSVASGRDSICGMLSATMRARGPGFHWTHDVHATIDPDNTDRATGLVYCHAEATPNGVASLAAMKYKDCYLREGGVWRFSRREINFFYYAPVAKYEEGLGRTDRVYSEGTWQAADFPENLDSWRQFSAGGE